jgi:hypothetical protein
MTALSVELETGEKWEKVGNISYNPAKIIGQGCNGKFVYQVGNISNNRAKILGQGCNGTYVYQVGNISYNPAKILGQGCNGTFFIRWQISATT